MPVKYNGIYGSIQRKKEIYQPLALADIRTANEETDEWTLHWRQHGPGWRNPSPDNVKYLKRAYGGSDMGTLMQCSHFKTRLELFHQKTGKPLQFARSFNASAKDRGHLYETVTARKYQLFRISNREKITLFIEGMVFDEKGRLKKLPDGSPVDNPISMMIYRDGRRKPNGDFLYPWALANCDGLIRENGVVGLLEIKTTSPKNFEVIKDWENGIVPEAYFWQVVYYMAILNVMFCDIVCSWGQEMDTMSIVRIYRDYEAENKLFKMIMEFDDYVEQNIEPDTMGDDPFLLNQHYFELFGPAMDKAPMIELPDTAQYHCLVQKAIDLDKAIKDKEAELDDLQKKRESIFASLYPLCDQGNGTTSSYMQLRISPSQVVGITLKTPFKQGQFEEDRFKADYPTLYSACQRFDPSKLNDVNKALKKAYTLPKTPDFENPVKRPSFSIKITNR